MVHKPEEPSEVEISPPGKQAEQDKIASDEDTLPDIEPIPVDELKSSTEHIETDLKPKEATPSTGQPVEIEVSQKEDVKITKEEEETLISDEHKIIVETPEASQVLDDLQHEELPAKEPIELPQVYCYICLLLQ